MNPTAYLYVPGDRPGRFDTALESGAGAVIFDLEDAVPHTRKNIALAAVAGHLAAGPVDGVEQWVRLNTDRAANEMHVIKDQPGLSGVVVPKASALAAAVVGDTPVIALIETAEAMCSLLDIARSPNVRALAMGEVDLAGALGIDPSPDEHELWPLRMQVVTVSAAVHLIPPIGPVYTSTRDDHGLAATCAALRRAGFESRQAIHPRQIPTITLAMRPSPEELDRAEELLAVSQAAGGAACVDSGGRMIDEAALVWARRVLARRSA